MSEQLELIKGVRLPTPTCYEDVVEIIENVRCNGFIHVDECSADDLTSDMFINNALIGEPEYEEVKKAINIYRERNGLVAS